MLSSQVSIYRKPERPSSNFNLSVRDRVGDSGFSKTPQAQGAAVAPAAGPLAALVTRPGEMQRGTQLVASADDFALFYVNDGRHDLQTGFGTSPHANKLIESLIVFGSTVRVTGAVFSDSPDEDGLST